MTDAPLLHAERLAKTFYTPDGPLAALDGVDLDIRAGETLAVVGESGCGKTTLARALTMLVPPDAGSLRIDGNEITNLGRRALKPLRRRMQMIFQDPFGSLNPRLTVERIVAEPLIVHGLGNQRERRDRVVELLGAVGLEAGALERYPHQFSGGQRQRIAIARALAPQPDLIIADEPVSALDVSVQSQILNLMADLQAARGLSYLFIGHDLAVVRHVADRVAVMYLGRIVEEAPATALFEAPRHPYTRALLAATPRIGRGKRISATSTPGEVPSPLAPPPGCPYHPRCPEAVDACRRERPELEGADGHRVACPFAEGES